MDLALFIVALILVLAGVLCFFYVRYADEPGMPIVLGVAWLAIGGGIVFMDSFHIVPTRTDAVETSFGKPVGTLSNGWHWMAPWHQVEEFDASVQTMKLSGDKDDNGDPIQVRLANAATAQVDITVQWQIDPHGDITALYNDYRHFDKIEQNVVRRELATALNRAFEQYDPLASLKGETSNKTLDDLAKEVRAALDADLPDSILIRSVQLPRIVFDDAIQAKINQFQAALAETQIAEQQKKTAMATQQANALLAAGGGATTGTLYQNCLAMVERLVRDGKVLPPGFTCGAPPQVTVPVGSK
jgi:regulator of protease activity HflC (stomatin/prohibitin superfamily)